MFRRPSSRRKTESQELSINLVPMLDALVTLVSFLLMTMGYMAISAIETPAPMLAPPDDQVKQLEKKDPPLQLTADVQEDRILLHDWMGSRENHVIEGRNDPDNPGKKTYDVEAFRSKLLEIKQKYPKETQIILKPIAGVAYESIVAIMDASRYYDKTDTIPPTQTTKDPNGNEVPDLRLFPEVIFGNILSDE